MGSKRFFEDGLFPEFSSKHPKLVNPTATYPFMEYSLKTDIPVESGGFYFGYETKPMVSYSSEKEVEISAPYSWVTSSSSEEEGGPSAAVSSSLSAEHLDTYSPSRSLVRSDDSNAYSSSLSETPAVQIPLGPDHQAELPAWNPHSMENYRVGYDRLMGDRIVSEFSNRFEEPGKGRPDCDCIDEGSVTCAQQHVREARQSLRADLGPEKFVKLGFCDMGDDISQLWTEEEERLYHEVVYSNPVSDNKNFWERLSVVFPSRTKKEIVSYYFNVFILRRRSVQNRSNFLDIDSDDDEWNVGYWKAVEHARDDDDSPSDSVNFNELNYHEGASLNNELYKNESDRFVTNYQIESSHEVDKDKGHCKDSLHENIARSSEDGLGTSFQMEPSHGKFWDYDFETSPLRFNDFLSTGQMIEEIFGASPNSPNSGSLF